ncbi:MAG: tail fiber domain-containing protein [Acidobacteriota bacterium]
MTGGLWLREESKVNPVLELDPDTDVRVYLERDSNGLLLFQDSDEVTLASGRPRSVLQFGGAVDTDSHAQFGPDGQSFNIGLSGASFGRGSSFLNIRPISGAVAPNPSIRLLVANQPAMILDNEGYLGLSSSASFNPQHPIELESGAHVTAGGVWSNASSRALKGGIEPLGAAAAMATLERLEPVLFHYLAEPNEESLGFIAEDVPEAVAHGDRTSLSTMDLVAVLTKVVQLQERRLDLQAEELTQLRLEVAALKDSARP